MTEKKIVAITSCPVGIAHTYMAAESLEKAGKKLGIQVKVETHGSIGIENELTAQEIREADGVIIAADTAVDKSRFGGKKMIQVGVQQGIKNPEGLIQKIEAGDAPVYHVEASNEQSDSSSQETDSIGKKIYKSLMNGVSYMVPFIVTGGLLIAVALSLGGEATPTGFQIPEGTIWATLNSIGALAMGLMIPILSAFIAESIADRPGLVPGFIGGMIAADGSLYGSEASAGFLGGILAGFLAGFIALGIKKIKVPKALQSIMPIIVIPVLSSVIVGFLFINVIGYPIASLFAGLSAWLASMQGSSEIILALILGAMISVDMGGPFNKVAFLFGAGMIAEGNYSIMGPIAVAICIPPIALGTASFVLKTKFTKPEKEAGKASFIMGFFGITEGAIPFATSDPLRVIPSIVVGSMAGAVVATLGKVTDHVAHGGPIVAVLGAVDHVVMFFVAVIVGVAVTVLMLHFLKKNVSVEPVLATNGQSVPFVEPIEAHEVENETIKETEKKQDFNKLTDILTKDLIVLDLAGDTQEEVVEELISTFDQQHKITSKDEFRKAIFAREAESTTGIGVSVAIPHGKSASVKEPSVVFGRNLKGIDWNSLDGEPAKLIFMIAVPIDNKDDAHLKILQMLSRKLMDDQFREDLENATSTQEVYALLDTVH